MLDEFKEAIKASEPYYLCLGSCYILTVKSEYSKLLNRTTYYINFQGASDRGLYSYSLLEKCCGVFFFSAWANVASVVTIKYFPHWRKILDELLMIGCPVVMVEAPLNQKCYKHPETGKGISIEELERKRSRYIEEVIGTIAHPDLIFRDMVDVVGYDSRYLVNKYPVKAPWHLSNIAIKRVTRYFIKVIITGHDQEETFLSL